MEKYESEGTTDVVDMQLDLDETLNQLECCLFAREQHQAHLVFIAVIQVLGEIQGDRPATLQDSGDGASQQVPTEDGQRVLRRLGFPEISETGKPSHVIEKAIAAASKRLKKLKELMPAPDDRPPAEPSVDATTTPDRNTIIRDKTSPQHSFRT